MLKHHACMAERPCQLVLDARHQRSLSRRLQPTQEAEEANCVLIQAFVPAEPHIYAFTVKPLPPGCALCVLSELPSCQLLRVSRGTKVAPPAGSAEPPADCAAGPCSADGVEGGAPPIVNQVGRQQLPSGNAKADGATSSPPVVSQQPATAQGTVQAQLQALAEELTQDSECVLPYLQLLQARWNIARSRLAPAQAGGNSAAEPAEAQLARCCQEAAKVKQVLHGLQAVLASLE